METVHFNFYNYKPRMRVSFKMKLHTVPVVGDFIHVDPKFITEVSTKLIGKENIKRFGKTFVVVKRTKHMISFYKEDWRIELSPSEPLENEK